MKFAILSALAITALHAQTIAVKSLFQPAPLAGTWRHQLGDDPRWSSPGFDDSAWPSVQMPEGAIQPGDGISWYRLRVHLPEHPATEPLALMIAVVAIHLRTATFPFTYRLDPAHRASWIGARLPIDLLLNAWHTGRQERTFPIVIIFAALTTPGVYFLLFLLWRRDAPEYFWFGLWLICVSLNRLLNAYPELLAIRTSFTNSWVTVLFISASVAAWVGFQSALFRSRPTWPLWLAAAGACIVYSGHVVLVMLAQSPPMFFAPLAALAITTFQSITYFELAWRKSGAGERVWAIHVAILTYLASSALAFAGRIVWSGEAFQVQETFIRTVTLLLFTLAMAILMNQRSARLMSERQRLSQEMESATEIQSLLLTSLPAAGSFYRVEPVYLPATEVGGDFYQILERADDSRVALVGDVSGKGLKAAMLVSVAIGALRREKSSSPAAILAGLYEALTAQGGFVTCCCVRYTPAGEVAVASAGHPAPYCDGREVQVAAGLPLGGQLTLVSDGVVEAENATRELFGFDRTREISTQSAQAIAHAARAWGQNADITVVTVKRVG